MSSELNRTALPTILKPRLQAFRATEESDGDVCLKDPRSGSEVWLNDQDFFLVDTLDGVESFDDLQAVFKGRFHRELERPRFDDLFSRLLALNFLSRRAEAHVLVAPLAEAPATVSSPPPTAGKSEQPVAAVGEDWASRAGVKDVLGLDDAVGRLAWPLFDPSPALRRLVPLLQPLGWTVYGLPVLAVLALGILGAYAQIWSADLARILSQTTIIEHVLLGLVSVNLLVTGVTALTAQRFRATVESIDLVLAFGFVPRFMARVGHTNQLRKHELAWLHAAPLLARLGFFSVMTLVWYGQLGQAGVLRDWAASLSLIGGVSFLFAVNPLTKGSGYHLLATLLEEPNLRGKSLQALFRVVRRRGYAVENDSALAAYALASGTYMLLLTFLVTVSVAGWLKLHVGAGGVLLIVLLGGFLAFRTGSKVRSTSRSLDRADRLERWRSRTLHKQPDGTSIEPEDRDRWRFVRRASIPFAIAVLFLPYPYRPSGDFEIIPFEKQAIATDISGTVDEVLFDGGDWLQQGEVIALLAHEDHRAEFLIASQRMAEQKAIVEELRAQPRAEQLSLARKRVEVAQVRAEFSEAAYSREREVYEQGAGSLDEVEAERRQYQLDLARVAEEQASLALVEAGAHEYEIEAAQAKYERWREERDSHASRIERSTLRMPFDGRLVTLHLKQKTGEFLERGEPFADVENTSQVLARIRIPESDSAFIHPGSEVELRTWAYFSDPIQGVVVDMEPNVTHQEYAKTMTVVSRIDNPDGALRAGMTGYAKIDGGSQPVWEVFSRAWVRFFYVEAWSWIP